MLPQKYRQMLINAAATKSYTKIEDAIKLVKTLAPEYFIPGDSPNRGVVPRVKSKADNFTIRNALWRRGE
jgi:hypothetical protein